MTVRVKTVASPQLPTPPTSAREIRDIHVSPPDFAFGIATRSFENSLITDCSRENSIARVCTLRALKQPASFCSAKAEFNGDGEVLSYLDIDNNGEKT
jgi:hypothetical protein